MPPRACTDPVATMSALAKRTLIESAETLAEAFISPSAYLTLVEPDSRLPDAFIEPSALYVTLLADCRLALAKISAFAPKTRTASALTEPDPFT